MLGLLLITGHGNTRWLKMTVISVQICNRDGAQRAQVTPWQVVATVPQGAPAACASVLHPVVLTRFRGPSHPRSGLTVRGSAGFSLTCAFLGGDLQALEGAALADALRETAAVACPLSWVPQTVSDPKRSSGCVLIRLCRVFLARVLVSLKLFPHIRMKASYHTV